MGIPFLPTRAATGSDILGIHDFAEIEGPYDGATYIALPPLHPDVALLHAWRASESGHVQMVWPPQHLWDVDVMAAHAADRVIVSVDEVVSDDVISASPEHTRLFSFEVDGIVEQPGGSWPTSSPPAQEVDAAAIERYVGSGGDPAMLQRVASP